MGKKQSKVRSLIRKLGGHFRGRPKIPEVRKRRSQETTGGGHRGIAAGNLAPGKQNLSAENVSKWRTLPASQVEAFVYEGEPLYFHSSNVAGAQYMIDDQKLIVEYHDGGAYVYSDVTEDEAIRLAKAQSKGGFIWDELRIRGTKKGFKKKYQKAAGFVKPKGAKVEEMEVDGDTYEITRDQSYTRYRLKD